MQLVSTYSHVSWMTFTCWESTV